MYIYVCVYISVHICVYTYMIFPVSHYTKLKNLSSPATLYSLPVISRWVALTLHLNCFIKTLLVGNKEE